MKKITLLCKVVDNFGDIGFVYRLSRSLYELYSDQFELTLVVSNLKSFSKLCPQIDENLSFQKYKGWNILDWNDEKTSLSFIKENFPDVILECFQCGRPDWLENILFDGRSGVLIVNIEYLTAEDWADDFHLLKSGTRSAGVKKINFMPGFTEKTAGLVLDKDFLQNISSKESALKKVESYLSKESFKSLKENTDFNILVFSYERDFYFLAKALEKYALLHKKNIRIFAAPGLSSNCIKSSLSEKKGIYIEDLPYLNQTDWDALLTLMDFNFIRGEDSFSRAALSSKPFIWDIYPQKEEFHLVKLDAFFKKLENHFEDKNLFKRLKKLSLSYNHDFNKEVCPESQEILDCNELKLYKERDFCAEELFYLFENYEVLKKSFEDFSRKLLSNGNLTEHLVQVLKKYF